MELQKGSVYGRVVALVPKEQGLRMCHGCFPVALRKNSRQERGATQLDMGAMIFPRVNLWWQGLYLENEEMNSN